MILCCGEALIDMLPVPMGDGRTGFVPHTGGSVFNTSVALGRLGAKTGLLAGLSGDSFGALLERDLRASHVDLSYAVWSDRPTTLAFLELSGGQAKYKFFDENSAGRLLTPQDIPLLPDGIDALFFGGISLVYGPGADTLIGVAQQEGAGRVVMLDPNIRPAFISAEASYRARLTRMMATADIVKVSDEDLDWICGAGGSLADKVAGLQTQGPKVIIVTSGAQGARAFLAQGQVVEMPARPVSVVDTVGAGDSFNAGLLAHLSAGGHLVKPAIAALPVDIWQDAMSFAARVAAVTVSRSGANPPWRSELT